LEGLRPRTDYWVGFREDAGKRDAGEGGGGSMWWLEVVREKANPEGLELPGVGGKRFKRANMTPGFRSLAESCKLYGRTRSFGTICGINVRSEFTRGTYRN